MNHRWGKQIPLRPFQEWLESRLEELAKVEFQSQSGHVMHNAPTRLAGELGWTHGEAGVKKLSRIRRGVAESRDSEGRRKLMPVDTWRRDVIEDALWHAGLKLEDVYGPEFADPDVVLEPAVNCWSPVCGGEQVHPIGGECPWCGLLLTEMAA